MEEGTLDPTDHSDWTALIVSVWKPDKKGVTICGDFRVTVIPVSKLNMYPIPKMKDLFATLRSVQLFTKLDLSQAYQQFSLDEDSKAYVVIKVQKGLFDTLAYRWSIISTWNLQKVMENLLKDLPQIVVYFDDILITSDSEAEHLQTLNAVLS